MNISAKTEQQRRGKESSWYKDTNRKSNPPKTSTDFFRCIEGKGRTIFPLLSSDVARQWHIHHRGSVNFTQGTQQIQISPTPLLLHLFTFPLFIVSTPPLRFFFPLFAFTSHCVYRTGKDTSLHIVFRPPGGWLHFESNTSFMAIGQACAAVGPWHRSSTPRSLLRSVAKVKDACVCLRAFSWASLVNLTVVSIWHSKHWKIKQFFQKWQKYSYDISLYILMRLLYLLPKGKMPPAIPQVSKQATVSQIS